MCMYVTYVLCAWIRTGAGSNTGRGGAARTGGSEGEGDHELSWVSVGHQSSSNNTRSTNMWNMSRPRGMTNSDSTVSNVLHLGGTGGRSDDRRTQSLASTPSYVNSLGTRGGGAESYQFNLEGGYSQEEGINGSL